MAPYSGTPRHFEDFKVETWLAHGLDEVESLGSPCTNENNDDASLIACILQQTPSPKRKRTPTLNASPAQKRLQIYPLAETTMNPKLPLDNSNTDADFGGKGQKPKARRSPRKTAPPPLTAIEETKGITSGPQSMSDKEEVTVYSSTGLPSLGYSGGLKLSNDPTMRPGMRNTNSSTRSRSSSPVKTMRDLAMADPPIKFFEADSKVIKPPKEVSDLYERLLGVCEDFQLLPGSLKSYAANVEARKLRDHHFTEARSGPTIQPTPKEVLVWDTVKTIRENARICNEDGDSEAGWGEMVYSQLFNISFRTNRHVGWKNITSARIDPKDLCPRHLSGKPLGSKMVDYAIHLNPSEATDCAILRLLRHLDEADQNINQTRAAPVRYRPITVNIEVKLPGEGRDDAKVQLSIWVAAQFIKLNALASRRVGIGIPLISVEGHDWRVYVAYQKADGEIIICGNDLFGNTSSVLGIYRIIAGMGVLAEWSHGRYRPWFEKEILGLGAAAG